MASLQNIQIQPQRAQIYFDTMAPRIANDCFPDEFLTVDYDTMGVPAPMGIGGGRGDGGMGMGGGGGLGGGGIRGAGTHDINAPGNDNMDNIGGGGAAAAADVAAAVVITGEELNAGTSAIGTLTTTSNDTATGADGGDNNTITSSSIENDPLSMGQPSIGQSHSSASGSDIMMDRYAIPHTNDLTAGDSMGTTITATMAAAAQHAWDQFVAGQGRGSEGGGGEGGGGEGFSPSLIPQAATPSTGTYSARFRGTTPISSAAATLHHVTHDGNDTTPTSYQQLLLLQQQRQDIMQTISPTSNQRLPLQQQHRQGIINATGNHSSMPLSVHSAPAVISTMSGVDSYSSDHRVSAHYYLGSHASAVPGQPVSRASSFGGFPTPQHSSMPSSRGGASAVNNNNVVGTIKEGGCLSQPSLEDLHYHLYRIQQSSVVPPIPLATVSRSNSVASSLTSSLPSSGFGSASTTTTAAYNRFLSSLHHQLSNSSLEAIPPSDVDENSPQETYGSIHSTSENSASLFGGSPGTYLPDNSKLSPGYGSHGNNSFSHSPKLPYSPSLLDQTSFPEEEDLSVGDFDDDHLGSDKYSPISKLDWGDEVECKVMNTTDITADITMDDSQVMSSTTVLGLSEGLASHVIHQDSTLAVDTTPTPVLTSSLRPRPSSFANVTGGVPSTVGGISASQPQYRYQISDVSVASNDGSVQLHVTPPPLSFGSDTSISDLTYYTEKGCIVDVLAALTNPHLKTLGSRMLADYAKMPHRRVAVASNTRILEFVQRTALEIGLYSTFDHVNKYTSLTWLGREYAVETVRSLTAAEENDQYLINSSGLLKMLALVARGGPFVQLRTPPLGQGYLRDPVVVAVAPPTFADNGTPGPRLMTENTMGVASDKARLHACIAIMNLSCGKSNKIEITSVSEILEAMRDVMLGRHFAAQPRSSLSSTRAVTTLADEARLKATTCIKNLSNADANDAALLGTPGLVETLGYVAEATCHPRTGATTCTTHACLALMNLSISKANKNCVFRTPGVMDALMAVITRTVPKVSPGAESEVSNAKDANSEARVKACSALSNLAIGYDNKIPMFNYPGLVESILTVVMTDKAEARTKACSILWSFAAEMKNQVPVVQRGDILPALVAVAKEDTKTEARFKCVAALTLLAESPENAVPLLRAGSLEPLMNILQEAGPDPTQWRGQTASWCVGFLMNMAQCDDVVPALLQEGIVDLLAPLLSLDHYQSLKAAMAVTFVCQYDTGDKTYILLRQTENVIPKIVGLLHNTLSGRGGSGYKYGVFTLRSSVGCIASLAAGPDFMKERIATNPVFESLLKVVEDFCVNGGTPGAIVGGGKDDTRSVTLAVRALSSLVGHLIPEPGCAAMPFGPAMDDQLITAFRSFEKSTHLDIDNVTVRLAHSARIRVEDGKNLHTHQNDSVTSDSSPDDMSDDGVGIGLSLARKFFPFPCGMNLHVPSDPPLGPALPPHPAQEDTMDVSDDAVSVSSGDRSAVRTFLLIDSKTGRRFAVPCDPSGGRQFNENRVWCFRRGRYCNKGEVPDINFAWSEELQAAYMVALNGDVTESSPQC